MSAGLTDGDLPGVWREADRSSLKGQRLTLRLVRAKVCGGVFAAVGGALTWKLGHVDLAAVMILLGFAAALVSENHLVDLQPGAKVVRRPSGCGVSKDTGMALCSWGRSISGRHAARRRGGGNAKANFSDYPGN